MSKISKKENHSRSTANRSKALRQAAALALSAALLMGARVGSADTDLNGPVIIIHGSSATTPIKIGDGGSNAGMILGGQGTEVASGSNSGVFAGNAGKATGENAVVLGTMSYSEAQGMASAVVGGNSNKAIGQNSVVAGGAGGTAEGEGSGVFAGHDVHAMSTYTVVIGGQYSTASGGSSGVFAGTNNETHAQRSVVLGGYENVARGASSAVVAGESGEAKGTFSISLGGGKATGDYSLAFGEDGVSAAVATNQAEAKGAYSIALGAGSSASDEGSVALGKDSIATGGNVSVGNSSSQRKITYVANGSANTDAANFGQIIKQTTVGSSISGSTLTTTVTNTTNAGTQYTDTKTVNLAQGSVASGNAGLVSGGQVRTAIDDAIAGIDSYAGWKLSVGGDTGTLVGDGAEVGFTSGNDNYLTVARNGTNGVKITPKVSTNLATDNSGLATGEAVTNYVTNAVNNSSWTLATDNGTETEIKNGQTATFSSGQTSQLEVSNNGKTVKIKPITAAVDSTSNALVTGSQVQTAIDEAIADVDTYAGWKLSVGGDTATLVGDGAEVGFTSGNDNYLTVARNGTNGVKITPKVSTNLTTDNSGLATGEAVTNYVTNAVNNSSWTLATDNGTAAEIKNGQTATFHSGNSGQLTVQNSNGVVTLTPQTGGVGDNLTNLVTGDTVYDYVTNAIDTATGNAKWNLSDGTTTTEIAAKGGTATFVSDTPDQLTVTNRNGTVSFKAMTTGGVGDNKTNLVTGDQVHDAIGDAVDDAMDGVKWTLKSTGDTTGYDIKNGQSVFVKDSNTIAVDQSENQLTLSAKTGDVENNATTLVTGGTVYDYVNDTVNSTVSGASWTMKTGSVSEAVRSGDKVEFESGTPDALSVSQNDRRLTIKAETGAGVGDGNTNLVTGDQVYEAIKSGVSGASWGLYANGSKLTDVKSGDSVGLKAGDNVTLTPEAMGANSSVITVDVNGNGKVEAGDTALVTGDTVYSAITNTVDKSGWILSDSDNHTKTITSGDTAKFVSGGTDQLTVVHDGNGTVTFTPVLANGIAAGDSGLVTGETVYNETRVTTNGTYITTDTSAADNLTKLDTQVANNANSITSLGNAGWVLRNNDSASIEQKIMSNDVVDVHDGTNITVTQVNDTQNGGARLTISTVDSPTFTTVTADTFAVSNNGPTLNADGLDMADKKITNLADGEDDGDAVNMKQLNEVADSANAGWNVYLSTEDSSTAYNVKPNDTVKFIVGNNIDLQRTDGDITIATVDEPKFTKVTANEFAVSGDGPVLSATGLYMADQKITGLKAGEGDNDAVNMGQLNAVSETANKGWDLAVNTGAAQNVAPGDTVTLINGENIEITQDGKNVTIAATGNGIVSDDNLELLKGDTVWEYLHAPLDIGSKTNKATGDYSVAIGGDQNKATAQYSAVVGGASNEATATNAAVFGGTGNKATAENAVVLGGTGGTASGANSVVLGGTGGTAESANAVSIGGGKAKGENAVAIGSGASAAANNSVAIGVDSEATEADTISVGKAGAERRIVNVMSGDADTDAVNVSQLKTLANVAAASDDLNVKYDDKNRQTVTMGGLNEYGNPNITGGVKITNVAPGELSEDSTDAVNGSQLYAVGDSTAKALGGQSSFDPDTGKVTASLTVSGDAYDTVQDALDAVYGRADQGWYVKVNDEDERLAENVKPGDYVTFVEGDNIEVSREGTTINIRTVDNPNFAGTVTATEFAVSGDGPVLNADGLDMKEKKIVNVAAGVLSETSLEAVNGSQLFAVGDSTAKALGGESSFDPETGIVSASLDVDGTKYGTVQDALTQVNTTANKGWNLAVNDGDAEQVKPGETVTLINGNSIEITRNGKEVTIAAKGDGKVEDENQGLLNGDTVWEYLHESLWIGTKTGSVGSAERSVVLGGDENVMKFDGDGSQKANITDSLIAGGTKNEMSIKLDALKYLSNSGIVTGAENAITAGYSGVDASTIVGGTKNAITGAEDSSSEASLSNVGIYSGANNTISNNGSEGKMAQSVVLGGDGNTIEKTGVGSVSNITVAGGKDNTVSNTGVGQLEQSGIFSSEGSSITNKSDRALTQAVVIGGAETAVTNSAGIVTDAAVLGGSGNKVTNSNEGLMKHVVVISGTENSITNDNEGKMNNVAVIAGAGNSIANDGETLENAVVIGGTGNSLTSTGSNSVILGGENGTMYGKSSAIVGGSGAVVSVDYAAVIGGQNGVALGTNSIALGGEGTQALGENSVALANGVASGDNSLAFGTDSEASGANAVALSGGVASGDHSLAFGADSTAEAAYSIALGNASKAAGENAIALGANSTAEGANSVAISGGTASGEYSVAISGGTASGDHSLAFGEGSTAEGAYSIALGNGSAATADNAIALGNGSTASADNAIAFGLNSQASGENAVALASGKASGENSFAFGVDSEASGANAVALSGGVASGDHSLAFGADSTAEGAYSIALGNGSAAKGANAVALSGGSASGDYSLAFGAGSVAGADYAIALGNGSSVETENGVAIGNGASVTAENSVAIGAGSMADEENTVAVGASGSERKIIHLAKGIIGQDSTDAINGSQLWALGTSTANGFGGDSSFDVETGMVTVSWDFSSPDQYDGPKFTSAYDAVKDLYSTMRMGLDLQSFNNDTQSGETKKLLAGNTVTIKVTGASADLSQPNLVVTQTNSDDGAMVTFSMAENPTFDGKVKALNGFDANGAKIINVASGDLTQGSTDAINGGQFYDQTHVEDGNVILANNTVAGNLTALDNKLGTISGDVTYIKSDDTVSNNLVALDRTIGAYDPNANYYTINSGDTVVHNLTALDNKIGDMQDGSFIASNDTVAENLTHLDDNLNALSGDVGKGWNIASNSGTDREKTANVQMGDTVTMNVAELGKNLVISQDETTLTFSIVDNPTFNGTVVATNGFNASGAKIINVAPGTEDTDAVNFSQLKDLDSAAVKYDDPDTKDLITLQGENGTRITNLTRGSVEKDSTDAVNGSQIFDLGDSVATTLGGTTIFNTETGRVEKFTVELDDGTKYEDVTKALTETGNKIIAMKESFTTKELTVTEKATFKGDVTMEKNLKVGGDLEVAGGASFGGDVNMKGNKITNLGQGDVGPGSTDAVTGGQVYEITNEVYNNMNRMNNNLDNEIRRTGAHAAALAALQPLPYDPLHPTQATVGAGYYRGKGAAAVGLSHYFSENARLNAGVTIGHRPMANVGMAFSLGRGEAPIKAQRRMTVAQENRIAQLENVVKQLVQATGVNPAPMGTPLPDDRNLAVPEALVLDETNKRLLRESVVRKPYRRDQSEGKALEPVEVKKAPEVKTLDKSGTVEERYQRLLEKYGISGQ
ncbi:MAG: YadA-like family protein [Pyramidobacter sp.]|nr:YadA-like family protein [Pyramidobacter sp.]